MPKVKKRDGTQENYSEEKIFKIAKAAGLDEPKAHVVAAEMTSWIKELTHEAVDVALIRDQMLQFLKKHDMAAANLYLWYEQTKYQKN